jgi:hypothetical protein
VRGRQVVHSGFFRLVRSATRKLAARDDAGAALILALVFLIVAALALVALVTFAGGSLLNAANLKSQRAVEYSADSTADVAIQAVRYSANYYGELQSSGYTAPDTPPVNCLGAPWMSLSPTGNPTTSPSARVEKIAVDCQGTKISALPVQGPKGTARVEPSGTVVTATLFRGTATFVGFSIADSKKAIPATPPTVVVSEDNSAGTVVVTRGVGTATADTLMLRPNVERKVTFFACRPTGAPTPTHPCNASHFIVRAVVDFGDVSRTSRTGKSIWLCGTSTTATCGTKMIIEEWVSNYANH